MRDEVLIIGCGEIGVSLIEGWLNKKNEFSKRISSIHVLEKNLKRKNFLKKKYKKKIYFVEINKIKKFNKKFKYVFLSFKPRDLNFDLDIYKNLFEILFGTLVFIKGLILDNTKIIFLTV